MKTEYFTLKTECLPHHQKPFRFADYAARDGKLQLDRAAADGIASRFNKLHDFATNVHGLVISVSPEIGNSSAGHFVKVEAREDGLYAFVTCQNGWSHIIQGDTVNAEFSVREGEANLESVEISRPAK